MEAVERELDRIVEEIAYAPVRTLFQQLSGGKRLRAKLVLKIANTHTLAPLLGAIVELIHAASLLHDDVIDDAQTRRGKPSVNATQGSKTAVMLGDVLYSKAFSELVAFEKSITRKIATSVTALSVGEMMDVDMSRRFNDDEARYMEMLYLKTAALIEAAASAAALLAGKDPKPYALYGKNLGLAFQIVDDILDIVSDEATLGKPVMNDYSEGKVTLPYLYLYKNLPDEEKKRLRSLFAKRLDPKDVTWIKERMQRYGAIEQALEKAKRLSEEAKEVIADDAELVAILEKTIQRSY